MPTTPPPLADRPATELEVSTAARSVRGGKAGIGIALGAYAVVVAGVVVAMVGFGEPVAALLVALVGVAGAGALAWITRDSLGARVTRDVARVEGRVVRLGLGTGPFTHRVGTQEVSMHRSWLDFIEAEADAVRCAGVVVRVPSGRDVVFVTRYQRVERGAATGPDLSAEREAGEGTPLDLGSASWVLAWLAWLAFNGGSLAFLFYAFGAHGDGPPSLGLTVGAAVLALVGGLALVPLVAARDRARVRLHRLYAPSGPGAGERLRQRTRTATARWSLAGLLVAFFLAVIGFVPWWAVPVFGVLGFAPLGYLAPLGDAAPERR